MKYVHGPSLKEPTAGKCHSSELHFVSVERVVSHKNSSESDKINIVETEFTACTYILLA
jgi:hypothetical protein